MGETMRCPDWLYTWLGRSCCRSRNLLGAEAAGAGLFRALRLGMGMASRSGALTLACGLALAGGSVALDSVSLATGLTGPLSVGNGIRGTTLTATDPKPPPLISPQFWWGWRASIQAPRSATATTDKCSATEPQNDPHNRSGWSRMSPCESITCGPWLPCPPVSSPYLPGTWPR